MDIDLNLLKVLVAVARHRSVSRAAADLGLSQPGVSSALARLRERTGDQLFVRTGAGMDPTPLAQALLVDTQDLLARLVGRLTDRPDDFSPMTAPAVFRLAMSDVGEMSMLPALISDLRQHAPRSTVRSMSLPPPQLKEALEDGAVDLAVGYMPDLTGAGFFQQRLFEHGFCCLVGRDNPLAHKRLSLAAYEAADHVMVHSPVRSQELIDRTVERYGVQRRIVMHTQHYMSLPVIVAHTSLVATVPAAVGAVFVESGLLRVVQLPFASPSFPVRQHWHRRYHEDVRHQWLRGRLPQLMKEGWRLPSGPLAVS